MLVRYLKAQGMVLLCGGLVGPIFLAMYFALGADPLLKWMFWTGLVVTALDVLAALWLANYGANAAAKASLLEQHGTLALARIVGMTETGTRINDRPLVKLTLQVEAPGIAPFTAEDRVIGSIDRLPMLTSRHLAVLVEPGTQNLQIDWNRSALVSGVVPAQFTLDEDGRTYDLSGQAGPLMEIMKILKDNGVPMSSTIDIRSTPAVRRQVMAVVRGAVAPQQSTPDPAPAGAPLGAPPVLAPPPPSTAERLQQLETLRATGAISDAEYTAKRQQILAEL
ncbi:SHOCT domain-containing protein [Mycolicibacterium confluentis]|uniref:Membrane protein n=1 Tax=Mycolicibacterium confluentis TaxID=28047 RepID=A0A7I7Y2G5_9MYCO|nr:SHOCT domain-containing protein [Mycolicibacterium confluentis]MCV7320196.1 SHOCT domain-containing protein [Mycolicibacterium confluentis]ORV34719.1 hypothetical protein AWB99_03775 [Mycolicibacterium confluentis]BBZ35232.1 membrane protein [Mycolicibacterium confluentis]